MQKAAFLLVIVAAFGVGVVVGEHTEKKRTAEKQQTRLLAAPKSQHHYQLQEHGRDTILRLDTDTGEMCWIALSLADVTNINQGVPKCL